MYVTGGVGVTARCTVVTDRLHRALILGTNRTERTIDRTKLRRICSRTARLARRGTGIGLSVAEVALRTEALAGLIVGGTRFAEQTATLSNDRRHIRVSTGWTVVTDGHTGLIRKLTRRTRVTQLGALIRIDGTDLTLGT